MVTPCEQIARNSTLKLELNSRDGQAFVHFVNAGQVPLWFPAEQEPTFRADEPTQKLMIWFGYFAEVFGEFKERYMLPQMQLVQPGSDLKIRLTRAGLLQPLFAQRLSPVLHARVATVELPVSRIRGEQPLEEYIRHSCVVQSTSHKR